MHRRDLMFTQHLKNEQLSDTCMNDMPEYCTCGWSQQWLLRIRVASPRPVNLRNSNQHMPGCKDYLDPAAETSFASPMFPADRWRACWAWKYPTSGSSFRHPEKQNLQHKRCQAWCDLSMPFVVFAKQTRKKKRFLEVDVVCWHRLFVVLCRDG